MVALSLRQHQFLIFGFSWVAYAGTYFLRKPLGVIKADLETDLNFTKTQLGWLDTSLLLPYALMQMFMGPVGDKFGPRKTFGVSLILSGLSMTSFGLWNSCYIFAALLFLNGAAQSQCWPSSGKAVSAWFSDSSRNTVFGAYGTSAFAGGIIGTTLAVYLQTTYGWRSVYLPPSVFLVIIGVLVLFLYRQPGELGVIVPGKEPSAKSSASENQLNSWFEIWKIPCVPEIALAMLCLKIVRYCMYMWLPMYLQNHLKYSKGMAGMFSTMFEIGAVFGSAGSGWVIDRCFQSRSVFGTLVSMLLSTLALVLFYLSSEWGIVFNSIFLILAGLFNAGPDVILGGSLPAELGELNGRKAAAAVVGLVNGFGSIGTFMEGPVVGLVTSVWGWSFMFHLLVMLSLLGTASVYKAALNYSKQQQLQHSKNEPLIAL
ncbi:uncharacterized protein LOC135471968 [Liolophura sinensis]|uniref:uncharacterized protein LOC135471968 n=1 Tax=Liolophura sinensis TaxID=3198878 RepID=UPI00315896BD